MRNPLPTRARLASQSQSNSSSTHLDASSAQCIMRRSNDPCNYLTTTTRAADAIRGLIVFARFDCEAFCHSRDAKWRGWNKNLLICLALVGMENAMCKFLLNYAPLYRKNYFGLKVVSYYIFDFGWFQTLGLKSRNFGIISSFWALQSKVTPKCMGLNAHH